MLFQLAQLLVQIILHLYESYHYQAGIGYYIDEHTSFGVHSYYHTLDELIPIFESIGN